MEQEQISMGTPEQCEMQTLTFSHQVERIDQKIATLAQKIESSMSSGVFGNQPLLLSFLELSLRIRKLMDETSEINTKLKCLSETYPFIEDALCTIESLQMQMSAPKYGFFERIRSRMALRRSLKLMRKRIQKNISHIETTLQANGMMSEEFNAIFSTFAQQNTKTAATTSVDEPFPLATEYLAQRASARSEAAPEAPAEETVE